MVKNFTVTKENIEKRPWTIITSAFSHEEIGHLIGNSIAFVVFAPKVYAFLGPKQFCILYIAGAIGCDILHTLISTNIFDNKPTLLTAELLNISSKYSANNISTEMLQKALKSYEIPSLGASGSIMAISAVNAFLFPRDQVFVSRIFLPVPFAVLLYITSDIMGLLRTNVPQAILNDSNESEDSPPDNVAHGGHLGGVIAGIMYVYAFYYFLLYIYTCIYTHTHTHHRYITWLWYSPKSLHSPFRKTKQHLPILNFIRGQYSNAIAHR